MNIEENFNFLNGLSLKKCLRRFNESEFEEIPIDIRDQEADGNTFLIFSNGDVYGFYANTEEFSIEIKKILKENITDGACDVSGNQFWKSIIDKRIVNVKSFNNNFGKTYRMRFTFENDNQIDIQYISESDYTFDALIIRQG